MRSRQFAVAVTLCAAAAAIALYAASRTWLVEVVPRPDPLPATTTARTGGSLVPLLPALALVGLAAAGGLLATRGKARTAVAGLLVLVGVGIPVSVSAAVTRTGVAVAWVLVAVLAGLIVAGVGTLAVRRGRLWPTMGSRYERRDRRVDRPVVDTAIDDIAAIPGSGEDGVRGNPTADNSGTTPDVGAAMLWDAMDRGEDPTKE